MTRRVAAALLVMASSVLGQQNPERKLRVQGRVVNLVTGAPVRNAEVKLSLVPAKPGSGYAVNTDFQGKFAFPDVAPGHYSVTASHIGFLDARYGARNWMQTGSVLNVSPIETLTDLAVKITPLGVIAGKITDEQGEPIAYSPVQVFKEGFALGLKRLAPVGKAISNDRGEYRIPELKPGEYVVQANPPDSSAPVGTPRKALTAVAFPAALDRAQAQRINVGPGAVIAGIDIPLRFVPVVRVKGMLRDGTTGNPVANTTIAVTPKDSMTPQNLVRSGGDGRFEVPAVAAGSYVLLKIGPTPQQITVVGSLEVADVDIDDLQVTVPAPVTVTGLVVVEGKSKLPLKGIQVLLLPVGLLNGYGTTQARAQEDGRFELKNLSPVRYTIAAGVLPPGSWVKSILVSGKEVWGQELDWSAGVRGDVRITISDNASTISGLVANEKGPANSAMVVLFPADSSRRHDQFDRIVSVDQYGAFTIRGVAPMEYLIFAFQDLDISAWQDPTLLAGVESYGQQVSALEGGNLNVQLKAVPAQRE